MTRRSFFAALLSLPFLPEALRRRPEAERRDGVIEFGPGYMRYGRGGLGKPVRWDGTVKLGPKF